MNYFLDQEFSEHFKLGFNLRYYHTIELIQIGIVAEDGREYTAINKNFNPKHANPWVKQNVLQQIVANYVLSRYGEERQKLLNRLDNKTIVQQFKIVQKIVGKSQKQIAAEVFEFINPDLGWPVSAYNNSDLGNASHPITKLFEKHNVGIVNDYYYAQPTFYGYYCDYDWVLFCSLFGTMMDLPPGFPMYMVDLKQKLDEAITEAYLTGDDVKTLPEALALAKAHKNYPVNAKEHDALADAYFNKDLHNFIETNLK